MPRIYSSGVTKNIPASLYGLSSTNPFPLSSIPFVEFVGLSKNLSPKYPVGLPVKGAPALPSAS